MSKVASVERTHLSSQLDNLNEALNKTEWVLRNTDNMDVVRALGKATIRIRIAQLLLENEK